MGRTAEERFWSQVDKCGPVPAHVPEIGPCWMWTGRVMHKGYGVASFSNGKTYQQRAHRLSWFLAHGEWPKLCVLHKCDNRLCVRPDHLFLGTNADNVHDMISKGRHAMGEKNGRRLHPDFFAVGERVGTSKLTNSDVRDIVMMRAAGFSIGRVSRRFNVERTTIRNIGKCTWLHIATPELLEFAKAEAQRTRARIEAEEFIGAGI